jgi:hypothetical protein
MHMLTCAHLQELTMRNKPPRWEARLEKINATHGIGHAGTGALGQEGGQTAHSDYGGMLQELSEEIKVHQRENGRSSSDFVRENMKLAGSGRPPRPRSAIVASVHAVALPCVCLVSFACCNFAAVSVLYRGAQAVLECWSLVWHLACLTILTPHRRAFLPPDQIDADLPTKHELFNDKARLKVAVLSTNGTGSDCRSLGISDEQSYVGIQKDVLALGTSSSVRKRSGAALIRPASAVGMSTLVTHIDSAPTSAWDGDLDLRRALSAPLVREFADLLTQQRDQGLLATKVEEKQADAVNLGLSARSVIMHTSRRQGLKGIAAAQLEATVRGTMARQQWRTYPDRVVRVLQAYVRRKAVRLSYLEARVRLRRYLARQRDIKRQ